MQRCLKKVLDEVIAEAQLILRDRRLQIDAYIWDYAQGARFLREFWDAAIAVDLEARDFDQGRRFPMCSPDGLRTLFQAIEVKDVKLSALQIVTRFASFDEYWEPLLSGQGSAPSYLASRDEQIRAAIRDWLQASLPTDAQGWIEVPARAWAIRATGEARIEAHARSLAAVLASDVSKDGWQPFRNVGDPAGSPHIISLGRPRESVQAIVERLRVHNIVCGTRGGRIRI